MAHHLTRPYKRSSSTLSTAERGGPGDGGSNAPLLGNSHSGGSSPNTPSTPYAAQHHASPARNIYTQHPYLMAPACASNAYYSSNVTATATENNKYARRRGRQSQRIATAIRLPLVIFATALGLALMIYLRFTGSDDKHPYPSTQSKKIEERRDEAEAPKDSRLRGGMSKHERAAAALLLADIIVHAEHDMEEEILKGKLISAALHLGANDDDYFWLAGEGEVPGAGHAYLPYEIDALDTSYFAVGVWIKPNKNRNNNRVIWSTLGPGACGGAGGSSTHDGIAGMELSIEGGQITLRYIGDDGSCQAVVGSQDTVQHGEWNHIGMIFSVDGRVDVFKNGSLVATGNAAHRAVHTHSDPISPPWHRPKGKMSRTFVGQRRDGSDGLDGRIALLSIWASDTRLDGSILKTHYEKTGRHNTLTDDSDNSNALTHNNPTFTYAFDGELRDGIKYEAVSKLEETLKWRHGTVRRHVPVEQHSSSKNPQPYPQITDTTKQKSDDLARSRRVHIKNAMKHAWDGYRTEAWGFDELLPVSGGFKDNWGGMAVTLVDSLSTLWLMGLKDEFYEARDFVKHELTYSDVGAVSVFETTIRSLGGLLSAFDLSGDRSFLDSADELGSRLLKAFDTPSGIPYGEVVLNGEEAYNTRWHSSVAILSEAGTMQLEFRYLSEATGKREYATKALNVIDELAKMQLSNGLFYLYIQNEKKRPQWGNKKLSVGAMGDSMYEYLLKLWLQGKKTETKYRRLYDSAIQGVHEELLKQNAASGLFYIAESDNGQIIDKMDHLSCFAGGMLALGAATHPKGSNSKIAQRDLKTAKSLAFTCYQMYKTSVTGLAPEAVWFGKQGIEQKRHAIYSILRPETVETFFILHQITGDPVYREWGWEIFLALNQFCRTDYGYGSLKDVNKVALDDKMESFFLAETLKYLYLLQDPDTEVDILNKHIFSSEAHPLTI